MKLRPHFREKKDFLLQDINQQKSTSEQPRKFFEKRLCVSHRPEQGPVDHARAYRISIFKTDYFNKIFSRKKKKKKKKNLDLLIQPYTCKLNETNTRRRMGIQYFIIQRLPICFASVLFSISRQWKKLKKTRFSVFQIPQIPTVELREFPIKICKYLNLFPGRCVILIVSATFQRITQSLYSCNNSVNLNNKLLHKSNFKIVEDYTHFMAVVQFLIL